MANLRGSVFRRAATFVGFPPGTGELLDQPTRLKLLISMILSAALALIDMAGVVAMLPMMQYVTGQSVDSGALGYVNRALGEPELRVLVASLGLIIFGAFIIKDIASLFVRRWQLNFMAREQVELSTELLEGYLTSPYSWHLRQNTSDKLWTVHGAVGMGFAGGLAGALAAFAEILTIVFIFGSLLVLAPWVALAAAAYFGAAAFVVQRFIRPRVAAAGDKARLAAEDVSRSSLQPLTAVKEIKLRRAHARFVEDFRDASIRGAEAGVTTNLLGDLPKYFLEIVFVLGVGTLAVVATTGASAVEGLVLLGLFVAAGSRILPSSVRLINAFAAVRFARSPLQHLVTVHRLMRQNTHEEISRVVTEAVPGGDVQIRDLRFAYSDQEEVEVLRGVDIDVPTGSSLAVVGSSGAGKSTLVDIILGLQTPTGGTVEAGGISIFDNLPAWQRRVAVVPQEVTLLDASIGENIAFDEDVDVDRLEAAVERAQLVDLVRGLPDGLDTMAGERGSRLSGGQRQRIGIARALYRNPSLLVLDEATSALDNETERRLTDTIESLHGSVTVVVVAHRLSTVRHCDRLIFMEEGRVTASGTFDEVRQASPTFARLVALGSLDPKEPVL
ncbi:ABC transporter ATP-binding protein [Nocardioides hwasunensis]|uniref:ABC transporter ATP-binding protein n=1 Tax=Nocardioides hwasunensis TaxID=397258 RepID=A0ABR8MNZ3_9ACTN|nr:ABC transporter ATP-binding protein [Nocardioides hwasunensis]MBD3917011.1 ABC transporter ATP-binding protein [Nocardioides hwasunensis]